MQDLFDPKDLEKRGKTNGQDADVPDEYKGKSPAELAKMLQEEKAAREAQETRMNDLQRQVLEIAQTRAEPTKTPAETPAEPDPYVQPLEAAEVLFEKKMAPYRQAFMTSQEVRQMQEVLELPFAKDYEKEIRDVLSKSAPEARMQEGYAKAAYHYVVGRHREEIREKEKELEQRQPDFVETRSSAGPRKTEAPTVTDEERRAAEGRGMSIEKYTAWRDRPDEMVAELLKPKEGK